MKCAEPGCGGIITDGYCDLCGTAPATSSPTQATATSTPSVSSTRSARTRRSGSATGTSNRGRLGAGIVEMPRVPKGDPAAAILTDPQVPERNRFCGNSECNKPVGRGHDDVPGRPEGFCTRCGARY